jgi:hypothetical protein
LDRAAASAGAGVVEQALIARAATAAALADKAKIVGRFNIDWLPLFSAARLDSCVLAARADHFTNEAARK